VSKDLESRVAELEKIRHINAQLRSAAETGSDLATEAASRAADTLGGFLTVRDRLRDDVLRARENLPFCETAQSTVQVSLISR
jgi:hypothetical protein